MNIIVDTSVIIAVIANEPQRQALVERTRGSSLLAPPSVHWEIGNAFSAMLRRKRVTLAEALLAVEAYRQIPMRFAEVELEEALKISAETGIYAYDAYLIRCASKYNAPLLTLDQELQRTARKMGLDVLEV